MASSLIGGLVNAGSVAPEHIWVSEPCADKAQGLKDDFAINIADDNSALVRHCNTVVVAVKPQVMEQVIRPLASELTERQPLLISVVAGITAHSIEQWLGFATPIVRVMPNTPALVGSGASGLFANQNVTDSQRDTAEQLMQAVGVTAWVPKEADIDSVTALSGSGPAYFMLFIDSLIKAGVAAGLEEDTAKLLAVATAKGAAELVQSSELSLQTLIDNVTSPKGTTEQALLTLHELEFPTTVQKAFDAAKRRSQELAEELA